MNQIEVDSLMTKLAEQYPEWTATEQETRAWKAMLSREDATAAKRAIKEMWEGSRYNRPRPGNFKKIIPAYRPRRRAQERKDPVTDVWIQCMVADPKFPARLGWFLPVFVGPLSHPPRRDVLMAAAECMRADYEGFYGGEWAVFQGATHVEMTHTRNRVRHDAGLSTGPIECAQNPESESEA